MATRRDRETYRGEVMALVALAQAVPGATGDGPGCEPLRDGLLAEPVSAVTSLAFVVAGVAILAVARSPRRPMPDAPPPPLLGYATLVAAIGIGSVVQHGPDPAWSDLAHDLPLAATLAFVAADAAADLSGRRRTWWWWVVPTLLVVPVIVAAPRAGDLVQVGVAVAAIALSLLRAWRHPALRRPTAWAIGLLAAGGLIGTLSRAGGPLCDPESLWQGHGVWHVLASAGLVALAPAIGRIRGRAAAGDAAGAPSRAARRGPAVSR